MKKLGFVLVGAVLALSSCAPGTFAPNRANGIPMRFGETWTLELTNEKAKTVETLELKMSASPQPGQPIPGQANQYRIGITSLWILGNVPISDVQYVELLSKSRSLLVYSFKQGDMSSLYFDIDYRGPGISSTSCAFKGWGDNTAGIEGTYSARVPSKDNPNALQGILVGKCILALKL
jgi:hypothetical protein